MQPASAPYYNSIEANADKFDADEIARMRALYDVIPPMSRFVHNDFHTRNIMESDGELMLIDLGESGAGNPLFDLIHSCLVFNLMGTASEHTADDESFIGITYGDLRRFWSAMLTTYCGSAERASRLNELLMPYATMTYLLVSMEHPLLPKEYHAVFVNMMREQVFTHADEMLASVEVLLGFVPQT